MVATGGALPTWARCGSSGSTVERQPTGYDFALSIPSLRSGGAGFAGEGAVDLIDVPTRRLYVNPTEALAIVEYPGGEDGSSCLQLSLNREQVADPQAENLPPRQAARAFVGLDNFERSARGQGCAGIPGELCVGSGDALIGHFKPEDLAIERHGRVELRRAAEHPVEAFDEWGRCGDSAGSNEDDSEHARFVGRVAPRVPGSVLYQGVAAGQVHRAIVEIERHAPGHHVDQVHAVGAVHPCLIRLHVA